MRSVNKFYHRQITNYKSQNRLYKIMMRSYIFCKFIFIFIFSCTLLQPISAQRQLSVSPMTSTTSFHADTFEVRTKIYLKNTSTVKKSYTWERNITDWTNGWVSFVCDENNCWTGTTQKSPKRIDLSPGSTSIFEVVLRPNKLVGQAQMELKIKENNSNKNVQTVKLSFEAKKSLKDDNTNFKIFPNPTTDYFSLEGDGIDRIVIFNIIGKEVRSYKAAEGLKYSVGDLPEGIYIIRLIGTNGLTVKTIRLSRAKIKA